MTKLIDAKLNNPIDNQNNTSTGDLIKNYLLSRHSSAVRIPINTLATGAGAAFFGMGKALYKDLPKLPTTVKHGIGGLFMGLIYFSVNEVANGIVRRSIGREQLFYNNTFAGIVTNLAVFSYLSFFKSDWIIDKGNRTLSKAAFLLSIKYSWTLCVGAMACDLYSIQVRHYFLMHGISLERREMFKINRVTSDGKRWQNMKRIEKLREEANFERYGTTDIISHFINTKDKMTFEEHKEQVQKHKEFLDAQEQKQK